MSSMPFAVFLAAGEKVLYSWREVWGVPYSPHRGIHLLLHLLCSISTITFISCQGHTDWSYWSITFVSTHLHGAPSKTLKLILYYFSGKESPKYRNFTKLSSYSDSASVALSWGRRKERKLTFECLVYPKHHTQYFVCVKLMLAHM